MKIQGAYRNSLMIHPINFTWKLGHISVRTAIGKLGQVSQLVQANG